MPAWQDIQFSAVEWAVGDLPLAGTLQPLLANLQAWADRFALHDGIRYDSPCAVRATTAANGCWTRRRAKCWRAIWWRPAAATTRH